MDFQDGEYAVTKGRRTHRIAASFVAVILFVILFYCLMEFPPAGGVLRRRGGVPIAAPAILWAAIWFADEISDAIASRHEFLNQGVLLSLIRWGGWFLMFLLTLDAARRVLIGLNAAT